MPSENDQDLPPVVRKLLRTARTRTQTTLQQSQRSLLRFSKQARRTVSQFPRRLPSLPASPGSRLSNDYFRGGVEMLATAAAISVVAYASYKGLARFNTADDIPGSLIRNGRVLHGYVVSVRDGDGIRMRHAPFLRRLVHDFSLPKGKKLSESTIAVRLAAVDAPETSQKYGRVAKEWLRNYAVGREVRVQLHSTDRYRRVVATVYRKHNNPLLRTLGLGKKNLSLELTRAGYATLYDRGGAQYGSEKMKKLYIAVEASARKKRLGMWADPKGYVSPMDYKEALRSGALDKLRAARIVKKTTRGTAKSAESKTNQPVGQQEHDSLLGTLYRFAAMSYHYLKRYR